MHRRRLRVARSWAKWARRAVPSAECASHPRCAKPSCRASWRNSHRCSHAPRRLTVCLQLVRWLAELQEAEGDEADAVAEAAGAALRLRWTLCSP